MEGVISIPQGLVGDRFQFGERIYDGGENTR